MNIAEHPILPEAPRGKRLRTCLAAVAGLAALLLVSACAGRKELPPPNEPPLALPPAFSIDSGHRPLPYWWDELGDEQLAGLIETALRGNKSVRISAERLLQAEALARKAGADLLPALDGRASAARSRSRNERTTTSTELLLGLAATYEVDLWGRLGATRDAAALDARASAEDLQTAGLSLAAQVAGVWYQLAESKSLERLLEEQQEVNRTGLELVRLRFKAGQVGIADLLQQRQLIESTNGRLARQRAAGSLLEHQLAILSGAAPGTFALPATPELIALPPLPATGVPADLLTSRPDLRSRYLALLAADRRVAAAIANRYPQLSLSANLSTSGTTGATARDLFDNWLASLAANLLAPIFDGGSRQAEVARSEALARERFHAYGQALLTAVGEVEDALIQEQEQRLLLDSLGIQLSLASRSLDSLKERYKKGTVDYQRILDALLSKQNLEQTIISERRRLIGYRIDLYRALGGKAPTDLADRGRPLPEAFSQLNK